MTHRTTQTLRHPHQRAAYLAKLQPRTPDQSRRFLGRLAVVLCGWLVAVMLVVGVMG